MISWTDFAKKAMESFVLYYYIPIGSVMISSESTCFQKMLLFPEMW